MRLKPWKNLEEVLNLLKNDKKEKKIIPFGGVGLFTRKKFEKKILQKNVCRRHFQTFNILTIKHFSYEFTIILNKVIKEMRHVLIPFLVIKTCYRLLK